MKMFLIENPKDNLIKAIKENEKSGKLLRHRPVCQGGDQDILNKDKCIFFN